MRARKRRLVLARLIRAVILQAHDRITTGAAPPVDGNIRTFYYRWLKPIVARLPAASVGRGRAYDLLVDELADLVQAGRVSYGAFGFADEHWENRRIGVGRPHVLVFAEKSGWIRLLRRIHTALDVPRQRVSAPAWSTVIGGDEAGDAHLTALSGLGQRTRAVVAAARSGGHELIVDGGNAVAAVVPVRAEKLPPADSEDDS